jgi:hypothetical protein
VLLEKAYLSSLFPWVTGLCKHMLAVVHSMHANRERTKLVQHSASNGGAHIDRNVATCSCNICAIWFGYISQLFQWAEGIFYHGDTVLPDFMAARMRRGGQSLYEDFGILQYKNSDTPSPASPQPSNFQKLRHTYNGDLEGFL